ncbi:MAG: SH3 domain-containing protein [Chloroflexota bacterium]
MTRTKYTTLLPFVLLPLLVGLACETTTPADTGTATPTPTPRPASPTPTMLASTATPDDGRRPTPPTPTMKACTVTSLALNVRSGPGLDYPAVDWLRAGERITITNQVDEWLHAHTGWIKSSYCK